MKSFSDLMTELKQVQRIADHLEEDHDIDWFLSGKQMRPQDRAVLRQVKEARSAGSDPAVIKHALKGSLENLSTRVAGVIDFVEMGNDAASLTALAKIIEDLQKLHADMERVSKLADKKRKAAEKAAEKKKAGEKEDEEEDEEEKSGPEREDNGSSPARPRVEPDSGEGEGGGGNEDVYVVSTKMLHEADKAMFSRDTIEEVRRLSGITKRK